MRGVSPAPNHRGGHHAVKNTLKHHALNAPQNAAERASLSPLRLLRSPRCFASSFHSLRQPPLTYNCTRCGSPSLIAFVKSLHASAALRGATPPSLGRAKPSRTALTSRALHCCNVVGIARKVYWRYPSFELCHLGICDLGCQIA